MKKDPYAVLGVSPNAGDDEIKKVYRELARKYHPDNYQNNPLADLAEEKMKEINEAYNAINQMRSGGGQYQYQRQEQPRQGYSGAGGNQYQTRSSANPMYAQIRGWIRMGNLEEADKQLQKLVPADAEWFFLKGRISQYRGWLDEALRNYRKAVELEPDNLEYRQALAYAQSGGQAYRPGGYSANQGAPLDCCTTLLCLNCLCGGHGC